MRPFYRTLFLTGHLTFALIAILLTGYTGTEAGLTDWMGLFSGLAYGYAAAVAAIALWYTVDEYLLTALDTWEQINEGNLAVALFAASVFAVTTLAMVLPQLAFGQQVVERGPNTAFTGGVACVPTLTAAPHRRVVDTAATDLGKRERPPGSNAGTLPKACLNHVGLDEGYPYCAACVSLWTDKADAPYPATKKGGKLNTAATRDLRSAECAVSPGEIIRGEVRPDSGSVAVWQKGNGVYGHAGILTRMTSRRCFYAIEANTTPSEASSAEAERDGGGVYRRHRCLRPTSYFSVHSIIVPPHQCPS